MIPTLEQTTATTTALATDTSSDALTTSAPAASSTETSTIESSITSALEDSSTTKRRGKRDSSSTKFSAESIEKMIRTLTKLVEAFAALAQAYRKANPPATPTPQPAPPPSNSGPVSELPSDLEDMPIVESEKPNPPVEDIFSETPEESVAPSEPTRPLVDRGQPLELTSGFLWKPVSDKDGNLAVLLPARLTGRVKSVAILSPDGSRTLQSGKYAGNGNGGREHFRFSKPGGDFPDGSIVLIKLHDGSRKHMTIGDTAARMQK